LELSESDGHEFVTRYRAKFRRRGSLELPPEVDLHRRDSIVLEAEDFVLRPRPPPGFFMPPFSSASLTLSIANVEGDR
jgi:hypothetical protein